jgi:hypothetical protein
VSTVLNAERPVHRGVLTGLAALVLLGLLVPWWNEARAVPTDDDPPRATLTASGRTLRGKLVSYCWTSGALVLGVQQCSDGALTFTKKSLVAGDAAASIYLDKATRPENTQLAYWSKSRAVSSRRPKQLEVTVEPQVGGTGVGWNVDFELPSRSLKAFIVLTAFWSDQDSPGAREDATYTFHVVRSGASAATGRSDR